MRRLRLRELEWVNCEALMRAAGQNLKRLLKKRGWRHRPEPAQAISAFFLIAFGWLTCPFLEYWSISLCTGSVYPLIERKHITSY